MDLRRLLYWSAGLIRKSPTSQLANPAKINGSGSSRSVCLGSGLIALDVIYDGRGSDPFFLAGGSCCNVLVILSYLGWDSFPLVRLGADPEGDRIVEDMERWGTRTSFVERDSGIHSPRIIERILGGGIPHHRFYFKCKNGSWLPRRRPLTVKSLDLIQGELPKPDVFYFDRADPSALKMATLFKERGSVIIFEPPKMACNDNFMRCLEVADIVKHCYQHPRRNELVNGKIRLEIQTEGEEGLRYRAEFLGHADWKKMDALPAPRLVDTAGSGDWLTAGMIHALSSSNSLHEPSKAELERSLRFGQALASLNCGFSGARGMMYYLERSHLLQMAKGVIAGNRPPMDSLPSKSDGLVVPPSRCRVCLCDKE